PLPSPPPPQRAREALQQLAAAQDEKDDDEAVRHYGDDGPRPAASDRGGDAVRGAPGARSGSGVQSRRIDTPTGEEGRTQTRRGAACCAPTAYPGRHPGYCLPCSVGVKPITCTPAPCAISIACITSPYFRLGAALTNSSFAGRGSNTWWNAWSSWVSA